MKILGRFAACADSLHSMLILWNCLPKRLFHVNRTFFAIMRFEVLISAKRRDLHLFFIQKARFAPISFVLIRVRRNICNKILTQRKSQFDPIFSFRFLHDSCYPFLENFKNASHKTCRLWLTSFLESSLRFLWSRLLRLNFEWLWSSKLSRVKLPTSDWVATRVLKGCKPLLPTATKVRYAPCETWGPESNPRGRNMQSDAKPSDCAASPSSDSDLKEVADFGSSRHTRPRWKEK